MLSRAVAVIGIGLPFLPVAQAQTAPVQQVVVNRGTALAVTTLQPLDSATARSGDDIPLRLSRPLVVNGVTLLREGEVLHGKVTHVLHAGPKCHYGQVRWKVERVSFADHTTAQTRLYTDAPWQRPVPQQLHLGREQNFAERIAETALGVPIIGLALLVESPRFLLHDERNDGCGDGKEYLLPAGSILAVVITRDHHVRF